MANGQSAPSGLAIRSAVYIALLFIVHIAVGPFKAHAANVAEGARLAQDLCSRCHVTTGEARLGWTNAPSFTAIANKPATTTASLQAFIQKPHMRMSNLARSRAEAADLTAYILTLRQKSPEPR